MTSTALTLAALLALTADGGTANVPSVARAASKPDAGAGPVGTLSKDEVTKVLKRHGNEVRSCYEQALRLKPTLAGKIAVKFIVGASGDVLQTEIASDTLNDENLKACMLNVVRSWKFPEPKGGGNVSITYPWVFGPNEKP
jgi:outer membrane biosynthesis protein TonB